MTSRFKSLIKKGVGAIHLPNLEHRPSLTHHNDYQINEFMNKDFYEDENYRSVCQSLDGGYDVLIDLCEWMKDYQTHLEDQIDLQNGFVKKWKSRLKHQSAISSYHTTKAAQRHVILSSEKLVLLIQERCKAIAQVIDELRKNIERLYPNRKHQRSDELKTSFRNARAPVKRILDELDKLREKLKKGKDALHEADILCENLSFELNPSQSKVTRATDQQRDRQLAVKMLEEQIDSADKELQREQLGYREKALTIFQQYQTYERERLDLIRQTLLKFIDAVHTSAHADELNSLYDGLRFKIENEQDTLKDLQFWAETYGINDLLPTSNKNDTSLTEEAQPPSTPVQEPTVEPPVTSKKIERTKSKSAAAKVNSTTTSSATSDNTQGESM